MKNLILTRPLAIIDLETTGVDPATCRIVEIGVMKFTPTSVDGVSAATMKTRRLNPGVPIPADATAIHGIHDGHVFAAPNFAAIAKSLLESLDGCDLAGFNLKRFDLKVLVLEFARCGIEFDLTGRAIIDACEIFHEREPRDLAGAVKFYTIDSFSPHSAEGDVNATAKVLDRMLDFYPDLPRSADQLAAAFVDPNAVDLDERFVRRADGEIVFNFGKYKGDPIVERPAYLDWMLDQSFLPDTKRIAREALQPQPEGVR